MQPGASTSTSAADLQWKDLAIGKKAMFSTTFTQQDIDAFAKLTGDHNPLHTNMSYAKQTQFGGTVAHGMLIAGLFSRLVGMHLPGKRCLYLAQDLRFHHPVRPGDQITVEGTIIALSDATRIIAIQIQASAAGKIAVSGKAQAQFLEDK